jgi:hypothetical protein
VQHCLRTEIRACGRLTNDLLRVQRQLASAGVLEALAAKLGGVTCADSEQAATAVALLRAAASLAAPPAPPPKQTTADALFSACQALVAAFRDAQSATQSSTPTARPATPTKKAPAKGAPVAADKPAAPGPPVNMLEAALRLQTSLALTCQQCSANACRECMGAHVALLSHPEEIIVARALPLLAALAHHAPAMQALVQARPLQLTRVATPLHLGCAFFRHPVRAGLRRIRAATAV